MKYSAIIAAGGQGTRFGQDKLLAQLTNKEVIIYKTLKVFLDDNDCQQIIVGCKKKVMLLIKKEFNDNKRIEFARPGETRFATINNCLSVPIKEKNIMIHDGVRCFIKVENLKKIKSFFASQHAQVVIPTLPLIDTVKDISNNHFKTLDRNSLVRVQTPQMFRTSLIIEVYHKHLINPTRTTIYDDSQLVEQYGKNIKIEQINGWEENRKITYKEDLF